MPKRVDKHQKENGRQTAPSCNVAVIESGDLYAIKYADSWDESRLLRGQARRKSKQNDLHHRSGLTAVTDNEADD